MRAIEQGKPVLESRNRSLAAQHQRGDSRPVANPLSHQLVKADARADFGPRQRRAAEHVPCLHAVDGALVGLLVPQAAEEDHPLLPRLERLQTRPELHARSLALGPPVLRVKAHASESDERAGRRLRGGVGAPARSEGQRFEPRQGHRNAESTHQGTSRHVGSRFGAHGNVRS